MRFVVNVTDKNPRKFSHRGKGGLQRRTQESSTQFSNLPVQCTAPTRIVFSLQNLHRQSLHLQNLHLCLSSKSTPAISTCYESTSLDSISFSVNIYGIYSFRTCGFRIYIHRISFNKSYEYSTAWRHLQHLIQYNFNSL